MTKNWSYAKITDILLKELRSVIVSQNHYLNKAELLEKANKQV